MKKLIALLLALVMVLSLAACGAKEEPAEETPAEETPAEETPAEETPAEEEAEDPAEETPAEEDPAEEAPAFETVTPGKLTVGTSPDFAPYEFYVVKEDGSLELAGFDIAMAGAVADALNLELEIVPMSFDAILMELQTGTIDMGIAGLSATPDRVENFDFSIPYYKTGNCMIVLEENKDTYTDFESLVGSSVAAQTGSVQMERAEYYCVEGTNIVGLKKVTDVVNELLSGKVQAAIMETPVARTYQINYPQIFITDVEIHVESEGNAIAFAKGNDALREAVDGILETILSDGTMDQFITTANEQAAGNIHEGLEEDYQAG